MGRRLLRHPPPAPELDRRRIHQAVSRLRSTMELRETAGLRNNPTLHRLRLGLITKSSLTPRRENGKKPIIVTIVANKGCTFHGEQSSKPAWQASPCIINFPANSPLPSISGPFFQQVQVMTSTSSRTELAFCQLTLGDRNFSSLPMQKAAMHPAPNRPPMVGRCEHVFWSRHRDWPALGSMEMERRFPGGPRLRARHWLGRSYRSRARFEVSPPSWAIRTSRCERPINPSSFGQCWSSYGDKQGPLTQSVNKHCPQGDLFATGNINKHGFQAYLSCYRRTTEYISKSSMYPAKSSSLIRSREATFKPF
ncbi:hypothetical protein BDR03DRAFT_1029989 [Suillus americanus]|nr:hypothetical protein BDR03DRAFT_1029989 [Suillus americanus]